MPFSKRKIRLQFDGAQDRLPSGKRLSDGMSAAAVLGDTLWLAHDETVFVERLRAEQSRAVAEDCKSGRTQHSGETSTRAAKVVLHA